MIALSLAEIAQITGGSVLGDAAVVVSGPAFLDSRAAEPGGLFAAFVGEHVDGHDFAAAAVNGGAAAVLASRATDAPTVVVPDVQAALQTLAAAVLARLRAEGEVSVIAITGSQGKTTVKDLLAAVLAEAGPTVATAGSLNNELGLPLTVLRADRATRWLVLEMGARAIGDIADLCRIVQPDVGVVVNVGSAHVGEFGSQAAIVTAKGELVRDLVPHAWAVLNADQEQVRSMPTAAQVLTFGSSGEADVRVADVTSDDLTRTSFTLTTAGESQPVQLAVPGLHQPANAAAAAAAAIAAGLDLAQVAAALGRVRDLSQWRMQLIEAPGGPIVLNDAYNANPESMSAAIASLAEIGRRTGRATLAVVGEMRELGADHDAAHRATGAELTDAGIDRVVVVGEVAELLAAGYPAAIPVASADDAVAWVRENVRRDEVVLVKASRAARLERVADALTEERR